MKVLRDLPSFERLLGEPLAIVFKHSTTCGISSRARAEAERFVAEHPECTVYEVDVHESRPLSNYIESKTGIRHESPQLLVLRHGEVVWHESHGRVTAGAIAASLGQLDPK